MSANKDLVIVGCGGHARSVADVAMSCGVCDFIFWDINARENEKLFAFPVLSDKSILDKNNHIFFAVGDNKERFEFFKRFETKNIINVVSKNTYIAPTSTIGRGIFIAHGVHVGPMVTIGDNTIINTCAVIEHECTIGKHSHISVNATIAGRCKIGDFVFVGAGAVIKDKISICSNVTIGAGSVVINNINEVGVYVGIPAKKIKSNDCNANSLYSSFKELAH